MAQQRPVRAFSSEPHMLLRPIRVRAESADLTRHPSGYPASWERCSCVAYCIKCGPLMAFTTTDMTTPIDQHQG